MRWRDDHESLTWRTPIIYRVFFPSVGVYFLLATVLYFDGGSDLTFTTLGAVLGAVLTIGPFRPVVRLEDRAVFVRGLLLSRHIALKDITDLHGGYSGLVFVTRDGREFVATGVGEKSNLARWLGRKGRADRVSATIRAARDALP